MEICTILKILQQPSILLFCALYEKFFYRRIFVWKVTASCRIGGLSEYAVCICFHLSLRKICLMTLMRQIYYSLQGFKWLIYILSRLCHLLKFWFGSLAKNTAIRCQVCWNRYFNYISSSVCTACQSFSFHYGETNMSSVSRWKTTTELTTIRPSWKATSNWTECTPPKSTTNGSLWKSSTLMDNW